MPESIHLDRPERCPICGEIWEGEPPYYWQDKRHATAGRTAVKRRAVVFIHGILSRHCSFGSLWTAFAGDPDFKDWYLDAYDYDFWDNLPKNGTTLADTLTRVFHDGDEVTLVGHSMGGLVGRLALLQHGNLLRFVKRLVMLGTPNHGTLHSGRMGILAQLSRQVIATAWSISSRKQGVRQLTEVGKMLREEKLLAPENKARTEHVEYVSIPGLCYDEDSLPLENRHSATGKGLQGLNLSLQFLGALPLWRVGLTLPHDGIVEESSVYLGAAGGRARDSERIQFCDGDPGLAEGPYMHAIHPGYKVVDHVGLQCARLTFETLKSLLLSRNLRAWSASLPERNSIRFEPKRQFG